MKKFLVSIICLIASVASFATDVWEGTHNVTWDTPLNIEASKFAGLQVGQKIVFEVANAEDVIEFHNNGGLLAGTRFCTWISGEQNVEIFVTKNMLEQINASGVEVCGKNFNLKKIWFGDGKDNVTDNTVWTGFFWMDEWTTLEISKNCFLGVDWAKVKAIRFYSEANRTDYVINILTSWGDGGKLGDQSTMAMTNEYAELNVENIDMAAKLADVDRLMIQCNKEGGNAFNFTSVELVMKDATAISAVNRSARAGENAVYTLSGQLVSANQKGIVIKNGKKYIVK